MRQKLVDKKIPETFFRKDKTDSSNENSLIVFIDPFDCSSCIDILAKSIDSLKINDLSVVVNGSRKSLLYTNESIMKQSLTYDTTEVFIEKVGIIHTPVILQYSKTNQITDAFFIQLTTSSKSVSDFITKSQRIRQNH